MNKIPILLGTLLFPNLVSASPLTCITGVIYQEARGVNAEEMTMVANTIVNQHSRTKEPVCKVTRKGYQSRPPAVKVRELYSYIAKGVLSGTLPDLTGGADHFNEGRKPRWPGEIKRVTEHFVFYRLNKNR